MRKKLLNQRTVFVRGRYGGQYERARACPNSGLIRNFANNADACLGPALSLDGEKTISLPGKNRTVSNMTAPCIAINFSACRREYRLTCSLGPGL